MCCPVIGHPAPPAADLLETPKDLAAWLSSRDPSESVGAAGCRRCPLANFLRERSSSPKAEVYRDHFSAGWGRPVKMPIWARVFVAEADAMMWARGPGTRDLLSAEALGILRRFHLIEGPPRTPARPDATNTGQGGPNT